MFVQRHHHIAHAVNPLGNASDVALRHDGYGFLTFWKMHQLVQVARVNTPRAPHDVNDVLMALGGDQTHSGPTALNQGVGAHRRAVRQQPDTAAKIGKGQA